MAGESKTTTDHDVIREWAEARDGVPASVVRTETGDGAGVLRIDVPGGAEGFGPRDFVGGMVGEVRREPARIPSPGREGDRRAERVLQTDEAR